MAPLLDLLKPGMRVFVAGSSGEPSAFLAALATDPARSAGLEIVTSAVPGINLFDIAQLDPSTTVDGLFMQPRLGALQRAGRFRHMPLSYAGFVARVADDPRGFDLTVVQTAPPDSHGRCSFGPAVEFLPAVLARSARVAGVVNAQTPALPGSASVACDALSATCDVDTPLATYDPGAGEAVTDAIAAQLLNHIDDGCILQTGLGKVPTALLSHLTGAQRLRLHGGMFSDGVRDLIDHDALDPDWPHAACVMVGSSALYDWARGQPTLNLRGCEWTHDIARLAGFDRFVAINSAVEVDLFGQAALDHAGGAAISGAGGAPDFARGATLSRGGISIVALPATAARGTLSRIVAQLSAPGVATLPRTDVNMVVTEHGSADLRGKSVLEIAAALIAIADPAFIPDLERAWRAIVARL